MSRKLIGLALIAVGGAAVIAGELLGVFNAGESMDTITELVTWLALKTHGAFLVAVLVGLGVLAWHFVDSYLDRRRP